MGFPGGTSGKEPTCQCTRHEMRFPSLSQEDALEEGMATHSSILSWRIPWTEEPGGYSPWGRKGSDMTERLTHTHTHTKQWLPRWRSGKESACQCRRCKRRRFNPWVGKITWRRKWQPSSIFLPGESHGQRTSKSRT